MRGRRNSGGNCPGWISQGVIVRGEVVWEAKVLGVISWGAIVRGAVFQGGIVIEPSQTSKTDLFEKIVNGFCNCSSTLLCFI